MGVYDGYIAEDNIRDYVDGSDLVITLGAKLTDSATAGFSQKFSNDTIVTLNHRDVKVGDYTTTEPSLPEIVEAFKILISNMEATFHNINGQMYPQQYITMNH